MKNIIQENEQINTKENLNLTFERMGEILSPFSSLLDGEIKYKTIVNNNKEYKIAESFFGEKTETISEDDINNFLSHLTKTKQEIITIQDYILGDINNKPTFSRLLLESFNEINDKIELLENAVYIEAAKGGYNLSDDDIQKYSDKANALLKVFGNSVSENSDEVKFMLDKIYQDLEKEINRSDDDKKITQEEYKVVNDAFTLIKNKTGYKNIIGNSSFSQEKKEKEISKRIQKDEQINLYNSMINSEFNENNIKEHNWKLSSNNLISGASVDQINEELKIPGDEKQRDISLSDALGTYTHEFGKHVVSGYNSNKYLGKGFKGANYLETEEGLASIFTALGSGKISSLSQLPKLLEKPSIGSIAILISEHYNLQDTLKIMNIYKKLVGSKLSMEDTVYRRKRFIHPNLSGSSPKDMSYTRGKNQVIYFLQSMNSEEELQQAINDLNTFKLNIKDRYLLPELKKELNIDDKDLMRSNFIGLVIAEKLGLGLQNAQDISFTILTKNVSETTKKTADEIIKNFQLNSFENTSNQ